MHLTLICENIHVNNLGKQNLYLFLLTFNSARMKVSHERNKNNAQNGAQRGAVMSDGSILSVPLMIVSLLVFALAVTWAVLPLIIMQKFNDLLKIEREAMRARAELAKAMQWILDNWARR